MKKTIATRTILLALVATLCACDSETGYLEYNVYGYHQGKTSKYNADVLENGLTVIAFFDDETLSNIDFRFPSNQVGEFTLLDDGVECNVSTATVNPDGIIEPDKNCWAASINANEGSNCRIIIERYGEWIEGRVSSTAFCYLPDNDLLTFDGVFKVKAP